MCTRYRVGKIYFGQIAQELATEICMIDSARLRRFFVWFFFFCRIAIVLLRYPGCCFNV